MPGVGLPSFAIDLEARPQVRGSFLRRSLQVPVITRKIFLDLNAKV